MKWDANIEDYKGIKKLEVVIEENKINFIYAHNRVFKTTLATWLKEKYEDNVIILNNDSSFMQGSTIALSESIQKIFLNSELQKNYLKVTGELEPYSKEINKFSKQKFGTEKYIEDVLLQNDKIAPFFYQDELNVNIDNLSNKISEKMLSFINNYEIYFDNDLGTLQEIYYKKGQDFFDNDTIKNKVKSFVDTYNQKFKNSEIVDNVFNYINLVKVHKSLEDNNYYKASNKLFIKNKLYSGDDINNFILENEDFFEKEFKSLTKKFSSNKNNIDFFNKIQNKKLLINIISEINNNNLNADALFFAWNLKNNNDLFNNVLKRQEILSINQKLIRENLEKALEIIKEKKYDKNEFEKAKIHFNEYFFNLPFKLEIKNKGDLIFGGNYPEIVIENKNNNAIIDINNQQEVKDGLSSSEYKAIELLKLLINMLIKDKKLFILDDFDNEFDILSSNKMFNLIRKFLKYNDKENNNTVLILTHNFTFFNSILRTTSANSKDTVFKIVERHNDIIDINSIFKEQKKKNKKFYLDGMDDFVILPLFREFFDIVNDYNHNNDVFKIISDLLHIRNKKPGKEKLNTNKLDKESKNILSRIEILFNNKENMFGKILDECNSIILKNKEGNNSTINDKIKIGICLRYLLEEIKSDRDSKENENSCELARILSNFIIHESITSTNSINDIPWYEIEEVFNKTLKIYKEIKGIN